MTRSILTTSALLLFATQMSCSVRSLAPPDATADTLRLTAASGPLPHEAFQARISFAYEAPARLRAGERAWIHILVKNASPLSWPSAGQADGKYQIRLGARWLDQVETEIHDGRGTLPYDMKPGDEAEVLIVITAPANPGVYILEFDLLQEQGTWFSQMGAQTLRAKLTVE